MAAAVAGHGLSQGAADNSAASPTIPSAVVMDALVVTTAALPSSIASPVENSSSASLAAGLGVSAASTAALTAAMGPLAALSSVLEKDKLEEMIQNAVRKVS